MEEFILYMRNINLKLKILITNAMYISIYILITYLFKPISFSAIQVRIAEAMCVLPFFDRFSCVSITIACFVANLLNGNIIDAIFGSLATLIGLQLTYILRNKNFFIATMPSILTNAIFVPFILKYGYGMISFPMIYNFIFVFVGQTISIYVFGFVLYKILSKKMM